MKYKTKSKEGIAIQYNGRNIEAIEKAFPSLAFRKLESKTWSDIFKSYHVDFFVSDETKEDYLMVDDFLLKTDDESWSIIPCSEFEKYWEEV